LISCVICVGLTVNSVISEDDDVLKAHRCEFACHLVENEFETS
jgi:hypothetical protein